MEIREVAVTDVTVDAALQSRVDVRPDVVDEYAEALDLGATFPPLRVCLVLGRMMLVDGYHRHAAYIRREVEVCKVEVVESCDMRRAAWIALGANADHGMRRTKADRERAITRALTDYPDKSHRAIAQHVAVDHKTVARVWGDIERARAEREPERRGEFPTSPEKRKDSKGRLQPATKPAPRVDPPRIEPPAVIAPPVVEVLAVLSAPPVVPETVPEPPKGAEVDEYADHIRLLSRRMAAAFKGTHLEPNGAFAHLKRAEDALRMAAPVDCPTCDGRGTKCRSCAGRGWVTRGDLRAVEGGR